MTRTRAWTHLYAPRSGYRIELIDQAVATFDELSHEASRTFTIGRFQAGTLKTRQRVDVLIASQPTLMAGGNLARVLH